jgi:hypothetical protein
LIRGGRRHRAPEIFAPRRVDSRRQASSVFACPALSAEQGSLTLPESSFSFFFEGDNHA